MHSVTAPTDQNLAKRLVTRMSDPRQILLIWGQALHSKQFLTPGCNHIPAYPSASYRRDILSSAHTYQPTEPVQYPQRVIYDEAVPINKGLRDQIN